jgi:D-methionine transport system ATP-binding protein
LNLLFEKGANEPVISKTVRAFDVFISVLAGQLQQTHAGVIGSLTVMIEGEDEEVTKAIEYMQNQKVKVEVREDA